MSEIKTITVTSTEQEITLDATYQFVWFRNLGDNDCYVSDHSGIVAGADDVALCKAGECVRITLPQAPMSNKAYIKAVDGNNTVEIHAQNFSDKPTAKTGKGSGGGQSITVTPLSVTENGVYTAPTGKAYSPVTVDVQEQPWQPLEDGYSNFWFELTNDTLSPWLNFFAKNNDAVIDWGDGSGEQPLTTLAPTHTYSKAGKYVVKVKGVTSISRQFVYPLTSNTINYTSILVYVELNSEVLSLRASAFDSCFNLQAITGTEQLTLLESSCLRYTAIKGCSISATNLSSSCFFGCLKLNNINLTNLTSIGASAFNMCLSLTSITIPQTVTNVAAYAFSNSASLVEIHMQASTPPNVQTNSFSGIASNYIIYVPVGTGDTYKAAWTDYADHIVEEGQTLSMAALRRIQAEKNDDIEEMR